MDHTHEIALLLHEHGREAIVEAIAQATASYCNEVVRARLSYRWIDGSDRRQAARRG